MGPERLKKFSMLKFHVNGSSPIDAPNQDVATVDFRIFAQSPDRELLRMNNPDGFFRRSMVTFLEGVPVSNRYTSSDADAKLNGRTREPLSATI